LCKKTISMEYCAKPLASGRDKLSNNLILEYALFSPYLFVLKKPQKTQIISKDNPKF